MTQIETVRCPNCGQYGERHHIKESNIVRTQCPECDYLLVACSLTGKVIECYAPGLSTASVLFHRHMTTPRVKAAF
jgi:ssDNA-binding Zn-finger/Zn-ribbon topoisomerase 1